MPSRAGANSVFTAIDPSVVPHSAGVPPPIRDQGQRVAGPRRPSGRVLCVDYVVGQIPEETTTYDAPPRMLNCGIAGRLYRIVMNGSRGSIRLAGPGTMVYSPSAPRALPGPQLTTRVTSSRQDSASRSGATP